MNFPVILLIIAQASVAKSVVSLLIETADKMDVDLDSIAKVAHAQSLQLSE